MKSFLAVCVLVLLIACASAIHPFGRPKRISSSGSGPMAPVASPEVAQIFKRSCMDCHSNQTVWPWYSYLAPTSWLVERDVSRGRDHMNLSVWELYTSKQKQDLLSDIASKVKNGEMPLPQYTLIHRNSVLSRQDIEILYEWARAERRKLKNGDRPFGNISSTR